MQSDDKRYEFTLNVSLSKSFTQRTDISIKTLRELKDPLVLSFDAQMPSLSSSTFPLTSIVMAGVIKVHFLTIILLF